MKSYIHHGTASSPEIFLSPDENRFVISGRSAPEDVRGIYYPVIEWIDEFVTIVTVKNQYTEVNPLLFKFDFEYFNSSSAKFLYDIIHRLKDLQSIGVPVVVKWYYEDGDIDLHDAGEDLSILLDIPFTYCPKPARKQ
jgi:two-component SAPR family response regulator